MVTAGYIIELVAEETICARDVDSEMDQELGARKCNEKKEPPPSGIRSDTVTVHRSLHR
jgi:hypothetical protein